MTQDLLEDGKEGRFFRDNLYCHSNRSEGLRSPEEVVGAYRDAGYDRRRATLGETPVSTERARICIILRSA